MLQVRFPGEQTMRQKFASCKFIGGVLSRTTPVWEEKEAGLGKKS